MRSTLVSSAVVALLALAVTESAATAAAKRKSTASEASSSDSSAAPATETPSTGATDSPAAASAEPAPTPSPAAAETSAPAPAAAPATEPANSPQLAEAEAEEMVEPPAPPPPGIDPIPATAGPAPQNPAPYVEQLGPTSFPGRMRGLYGGSLWLEPSFHGLQWPYMAHTGLGVSGYVWADTGDEMIKRDPKKMPNTSMLVGQERAVLRFTPTYVSGRFFIQGQVEVVGNSCQTQGYLNTVCANGGTFTTDDLWIKVGHWNIWDLQIGRFQAWEIYHYGMGLDQYTFERLGAGMFGVDIEPKTWDAPSIYGVNYLYDRPKEGLGVGYLAGHFYFTDFLRFELLGKAGTDNNRSDNSTGDAASSYWGGRPTLILDVGWLKMKLGAEYQKRTPTTQGIEPGPNGAKKDPVSGRTNWGVGGAVQFVIDPVIEFGVNAAYGKQAETDGFAKTVPENSFVTKSFGGFANLRLSDLFIAGVGANWTGQTDEFLATTEGSNTNNYASHVQGFLALQYMIAGQLFVKAVFGYAQAYFQPSDINKDTWSNHMYSERIRLTYIF